MADDRIIRLNERLKLVSGGTFQLGTALLAASIVKAYLAGAVSLETLSWLIGAFALMYAGWKILLLLEADS